MTPEACKVEIEKALSLALVATSEGDFISAIDSACDWGRELDRIKIHETENQKLGFDAYLAGRSDISPKGDGSAPLPQVACRTLRLSFHVPGNPNGGSHARPRPSNFRPETP